MAKWRRGHRGGHIGPVAQAWGEYLDQERAMAAVSDAVDRFPGKTWTVQSWRN